MTTAPATISLQAIRRSIRVRKLQDQVFMYFAMFCLLSGLLVLIALVLQLLVTAIGFSTIEDSELERGTIQMVAAISSNPNSPASSEVAGMSGLLAKAQSDRLAPAIPSAEAMISAVEGAIRSGEIPRDKADKITPALNDLKVVLAGTDTATAKLSQLGSTVAILGTELEGINLSPPVMSAFDNARTTLASAQDRVLNLNLTDAESIQFDLEFNQLFTKVNSYAGQLVQIPYSGMDVGEQESAREALQAANPAMAEIFASTQTVCAGEIFPFAGLWVCRVPSKLSFRFLNLPPSASHEDAGVKIGIFGSLGVIIVMSVLAIPFGVATGVFLEEYAPDNFFTNFVEVNITNLAGVPAIVYGLLALGIFRVWFGPSILTGGCTLACLILPVIIVTTRESIKAVPVGIREAAFALGASKWTMIKDHLLPYSIGGILTGIIIAVSRALGEASSLITIGAAGLILFTPFEAPTPETLNLGPFNWLLSQFTVMPILMFDWVQRPVRGFQTNAAAAGVVLVFMTLILNGIAIYVRSYARSRIKW